MAASELDKGSVDVSASSVGSFTPAIPFQAAVEFTPSRFESEIPFTPDVQYPQGPDEPVSAKTSSL